MITPGEIEASLRQPLASRALPLMLGRTFPAPASSTVCTADFQSAVSRVSNPQALVAGPALCRLEVGDTAGWKPAVHPWLACTSIEDLKAFSPPESILTECEKARTAAFKVARARASFILGRLAAKLALGALVNEHEWTRIGVANGALGQPLVQHPLKHDAEVSLSHVDGLAAAVAFPRTHPMGLDLELIAPDRVATVKSEVKLLSEEVQWLRSTSVPEPDALIMLWTIREALGKVLRCGIGCSLELLGVDQITISGTPGMFCGTYRSFPAFQFISWMLPRRVLTLALPKLITVTRCI